VAQTFQENDRSNPTKDEDDELGRLLLRIYRSFRNRHPAEKQQKALPCCVIREIAHLQATETQRAICQLAISTFFFAMRSCEYLKVKEQDKRRTDILRLADIRFLRAGEVLEHRRYHL
jgi:hypothetical protein